MPKEYQEVECEVITETINAVYIGTMDGEEHWVPKSLIEDNGQNYEEGAQLKLYIEQWKCEQEGIE